MPTLWAHGQYWEFSDTVVAPVAVSGPGGYPRWQASVITPSLLGGLQAWWERLVWIVRMVRRLRGLSDEQIAVVSYVQDLVTHPAYPSAQKAVDETAHTLGFNRPDAWVQYSRLIKSSRGRAENIFRHVKACERTRELASSTLTNPACNLLVELAYHGYAVKGTISGHV